MKERNSMSYDLKIENAFEQDASDEFYKPGMFNDQEVTTVHVHHHHQHHCADLPEPINAIKVDSEEDIVTQEDKDSSESSEEKAEEKKIKERENWVGKADFFLSALAYAVGLGAVWRFPYLCYKNGGGVFLIPYFIFLFLVGIPLVLLEMSVGQFTSTGPLTCWRMTPLFRGIGLSMNVVNGYLCIYYNMILAYALYYLYQLFANIMEPDLPWSRCSQIQGASSGCVDNFTNVKYFDCLDDTLYRKCPNSQCYNLTDLPLHNLTLNSTCAVITSAVESIGYWKITFPSQDFWAKNVLEMSSGIEQTGSIVWKLVLALFISWVIVYMMVINGIKVSGKLVYFTALFPYVVLLILGINGWMLPGADLGIKYYIYPDFSKLKDYQVWVDAATQIFFTLSVSYGGMIALSSYNTFHTNIYRDAIFVSLSNCLTSVFAGFVIFSYMGSLAYYTNQHMENILQAGQGLAYVIYPFAVTTLKGSKFWAFLFFLMMLVLGLDTMMASVETMITSVFDIAPKFKKNRLCRFITITTICLLLFAVGILFCTQAGTYWVEVFDSYSGSWGILLVAAIECICISWFYGFENFRNDISCMIGTKWTHHWSFNMWRVLWAAVSPLLLVGIVVFSFVAHKGLESNGYKYPFWADLVGSALSASTFCGVVFWGLGAVFDALFVNKRPLNTLLKPDHGWKPLKLEHQLLVCITHDKKMTGDKEKHGTSNQCFNPVDVEKY